MGPKQTNCTPQTTKFNHEKIFFYYLNWGHQNMRKTGADVYILRTTRPMTVGHRSICLFIRAQRAFYVKVLSFFFFIYLCKWIHFVQFPVNSKIWRTLGKPPVGRFHTFMLLNHDQVVSPWRAMGNFHYTGKSTPG